MLGKVAAIARFPVKSLVGEKLDTAVVDGRGIVGDRLWAVRDPDGRLGSGKNTRRFRRMPGLLDLAARHDHDLVPVVRFPDGRELRGDEPGVHELLSAHVRLPVRLGPEAEVSHFDEAPIHMVTTSSLARLSELHGAEVDVRRLRANLVIDTGLDPRFDEDTEDTWVGHEVSIGDNVVVRVRKPMVRCVMVGLPQIGLDADDDLLTTIGQVNNTELGFAADVVASGTLRLGDAVRVR